MKTKEQIKEKINKAEELITEMMQRPTSERDDNFWFDLIRLRNGQKALEWVLSPEDYVQMTAIDTLLKLKQVEDSFNSMPFEYRKIASNSETATRIRDLIRLEQYITDLYKKQIKKQIREINGKIKHYLSTIEL